MFTIDSMIFLQQIEDEVRKAPGKPNPNNKFKDLIGVGKNSFMIHCMGTVPVK